MIRRSALTLAALAALLAPSLPSAPRLVASPAFAQTTKGPSGLPLPRFVSLKSSRINVRRGPGQEYDIAFIFVRAGLPVEIIQEYDNWRKVRDSAGDEGWIWHSLLSGRRTAMVAPWEKEGQFALRAAPDPGAAVVAYLEPGVMADVESCNGSWCRLTGENYAGWIEQDRLWGVYPAEIVKG
ncbi:SH3 domain-containing protein [Propylenella binzhouense]|uniref:Aspartyl-trna synthetase n=1 Tax=Propylenella binzhouense TaxID=2555902 RepID=A0A964WUJ8_9HYPH|nr:SH3 domain-containing protein [Propylenella binzhouense]MYZ49146.1 aspartyl-trna synthetase [Propylenella binzhouense]